MKTSLLRFLAGAVLLGLTAVAGWSQTHAGAIKAMKVTGIVQRLDSAGAAFTVTDGTVLSESDTIVTSPNSGVVLVFMNGSSVKLGANTRLLVEEFKMDPLDTPIAVGQLKQEPSTSQTKLNLAYGEMVGDVKKLNSGSSYNIKTAVGAAGIRGTQFRIVLTPSADGKTFAFQLSTAEGRVVFEGTANTAPVEVPAGKAVEVAANVDISTGTVSSSQVTSGTISTEAAAAIQQAVTQSIQQAQQNGAFTPAEQQSAGGGGGGSSGSGAGAGSGSGSGSDAAGSPAPQGSTSSTSLLPVGGTTTQQPTNPSSVSPH